VNFKDLTREQKQYLILGGVVGLAVLGLIVVGIRFNLTSIQTAVAEIAELEEKIESADRNLAKRDAVSERYFNTKYSLQKNLRQAPPEKNYYSWATEIIYAMSRKTGLEIDVIDEISFAASLDDEKKGKKGIELESYSLRITAHGNFAEAKKFIQGMENDYPLVRFFGLDISVGNTPEDHDVQLYVQWPSSMAQITDTWTKIAEHQERVYGLAGPPKAALAATNEPDPVKTEAQQPAPAAAPEQTARPDPKPVPPVVKAEPKAPVSKPAPALVAVPSAPTPPPTKPKPEDATYIRAPKPEPKAVVKAEPVSPAPAAAPLQDEPGEDPMLTQLMNQLTQSEQADVKPEEPKAEAKPQNDPLLVDLMQELSATNSVAATKPEQPAAPAEPDLLAELDKHINTARKSDKEPESVKPEKPEVESSVADLLAQLPEAESPEEKPAASIQEETPVRDESGGELSSILAAMNSEDYGEPVEPSTPVEEDAGAGLEDYLKTLAEEKVESTPVETVPQVEVAATAELDEPVFVPGPEPVTDPLADMPYNFATGGRSNALLEELLVTREDNKKNKSLGSFLDGLVGEL
jgi:hypothetical protein